MVFQADIRCPPVRVELNVNFVEELLEGIHILDDNIPTEVVYHYVLELENELALAIAKDGYINIYEWFEDNYNAYDRYSDIEKYIIEEIC